MRTTLLPVLTLTASLALCGCGDAPDREREIPVPVAKPLAEVESEAHTGNAAAGGSGSPVERQFPGLTITIPAGWEERPLTSDVLHAEYRRPADSGPARVTLSSARGGVAANLERWKGQFRRGPDDAAATETTVDVDGAEAVLIELHGTFTDGFSGGGPQPDWAMLGAVIPLTGDSLFFIKLTGPRETIATARNEFQTLLTTARLKR